MAGSRRPARIQQEPETAWLDQEAQRAGGQQADQQESGADWLEQEAQRRGEQAGDQHDSDQQQASHRQEDDRQQGGEQRPAIRRDPGRGEQATTPARSLSPKAATAGAVGRHCWIVDADRWPGSWPALLLEWRKDETGSWWGRCLLAGAYSPHGLTVTDTWISAEHLQPIVPDMPSPSRR